MTQDLLEALIRYIDDKAEESIQLAAMDSYGRDFHRPVSTQDIWDAFRAMSSEGEKTNG